MRWQWREDKAPGDPWTNMAVDEEMFAAVVSGERIVPSVRAYWWDRQSISIGRLQDEVRVRTEYPSLPLVRRPTGGRAVIHGNDVCLSVISRLDWLPLGSRKGVLSSYHLIMTGMIIALQASGYDAVIGAETIIRKRHYMNCFEQVAVCDVADAATGRKLIGSAQRRWGGALLQQMSVPQDILPDTPVFLSTVRQSLKQTLGVDEWLMVDTLVPL